MSRCKQDYVYPNLEQAIKDSGLKLNFIANKLNIHVVSLNNKRIGYILWRQDEKRLVKSILGYKGSIEDLFYTEFDMTHRKQKNKNI